MRIAFFADIFYPELSGITDTILLTGIELARRNHQIEYFVPAYSKKNYNLVQTPRKELDLGANIKICRIPSMPFKAGTLQGRAVIPNPLRALFSRKKFDIVHSHHVFGVGLDALFMAKFKKIPFVGTNHTLFEAFIRYYPKYVPKIDIMRYATWYYNRCDLLTTPSHYLLEDMKLKGLKKPAQVISNPIDSSFFKKIGIKNTLKKSLGFSPFTILYAGRLSSEKCVDLLIDPFISFAKKAPDASLVIVGHGTLRKSLEQQAHASGLGKRIKIMGPFMGKNKNILFDIFQASDVFIMPSTSETQSMAVLQAMASGLPIIAADAGALSEIVGVERGLLFTPGHTKEIRACFEKLYREKNLRESFIDNEQTFIKKFSVSNITDIWEKTYKSILK